MLAGEAGGFLVNVGMSARVGDQVLLCDRCGNATARCDRDAVLMRPSADGGQVGAGGLSHPPRRAASSTVGRDFSAGLDVGGHDLPQVLRVLGTEVDRVLLTVQAE